MVLAVLFLFLSLQVIRFFIGESVCNEGAAWGVSVPMVLLIGVGIGMLFLVSWMMHSHARGRLVFWGALFFAGGLSNVYERISFGCVTDYIAVFSWFPVFNMADVLLTIAVIGFLWEERRWFLPISESQTAVAPLKKRNNRCLLL